MAVLAPMPSASVMIATAAKPGDFCQLPQRVTKVLSESGHHQVPISLFVTQRDHGIDFRCLVCGNVAGEQGGDEQRERDRAECGHINRAYAIEHAAHGATDKAGAHQSQSQTDGGQNNSFLQNQPEHVILSSRPGPCAIRFRACAAPR